LAKTGRGAILAKELQKIPEYRKKNSRIQKTQIILAAKIILAR